MNKKEKINTFEKFLDQICHNADNGIYNRGDPIKFQFMVANVIPSLDEIAREIREIVHDLNDNDPNVSINDLKNAVNDFKNALAKDIS